ncbi:hypothetical protein GOBAR_DD21041 [Gossypium barbadense]|nr:hypothetical protein GOBAR_DD21041 [Gossypium barbadense]
MGEDLCCSGVCNGADKGWCACSRIRKSKTLVLYGQMNKAYTGEETHTSTKDINKVYRVTPILAEDIRFLLSGPKPAVVEENAKEPKLAAMCTKSTLAHAHVATTCKNGYQKNLKPPTVAPPVLEINSIRPG